MKQDEKVSPGKKDAGSKGGGAGLYIYKGFYLLVFRFSFRCSFKKVVPNSHKKKKLLEKLKGNAFFMLYTLLHFLCFSQNE